GLSGMSARAWRIVTVDDLTLYVSRWHNFVRSCPLSFNWECISPGAHQFPSMPSSRFEVSWMLGGGSTPFADYGNLRKRLLVKMRHAIIHTPYARLHTSTLSRL